MIGSRVAGVVAALAVLVVACGDDGPGADLVGIAAPPGTPESPRTIEIAMVDIAFEPTAVTVRPGESVRFVFTNEGVVEHEATFGDEAEQEEHAALMREAEGMNMDGMDGMDGMEGTSEPDAGHATDDAHGDGHGDEAAPIVLEPGGVGEVIMTFEDPDVLSTIIGCHVPGHWEAGMRLDVTVATA